VIAYNAFMQKKRLVVANWKMNPSTVEEAKSIFSSIKKQAAKLRKIDIVVCPSSPHISILSKLLGPKNIFLGAQNCHPKTSGAYTGGVSINQLKDLKVRYVIVGHSERRRTESDEIVNEKLKTVLAAGLTPIVCIGERERDKEGQYLSFIKEQLFKTLNGISKKDLLNLIIAYEPVWAIGGRVSISGTDMHEMAIFIRKILSDAFGADYGWHVRILYGAAVEPQNASELMQNGEIQGLLVGHASLVPEEFKEILKAVESVK
jgi:triosephosphate isomerase (TIM)